MHGYTHNTTKSSLQEDKGDQSGFEVILEKHLNGKFAMKDMLEYYRERY